MDISFVIPVKNESKSVKLLHQQIVGVMRKIKKSYEVIFVDDGSSDKTFDVLKKLKKSSKGIKIKETIKIVKLRGNWGKSVALQAGFENSNGKIVFTMDGDLQDDPAEIPNFLQKLDEGYDLVSGWKKERHDPFHKVIPSRILNKATAILTGVKIHDVNCGFKVYKREVVDNLDLRGELYRFIPILAASKNYKVTEIIVAHRKRKYGKSKFGLDRNIKGLLDLLTIVFITGYFKKPGHFFGFFGLLASFLGFMIEIYITYLRITTGSVQYRYPLLFLGMLLMIIGVQLISTGLLAEMIIHTKGRESVRNSIEGIY